MESMQPWGEKFNLPQQKPPQQQISLSREERLEAKRLAEESNFSFDIRSSDVSSYPTVLTLL